MPYTSMLPPVKPGTPMRIGELIQPGMVLPKCPYTQLCEPIFEPVRFRDHPIVEHKFMGWRLAEISVVSNP